MRMGGPYGCFPGRKEGVIPGPMRPTRIDCISWRDQRAMGKEGKEGNERDTALRRVVAR